MSSGEYTRDVDPESFSFDIYGDLETELEHAYDNNHNQDVTDEVVRGGLQAVIEARTSKEVGHHIDWARSYLEEPRMLDGHDLESPLATWKRYEMLLGRSMPTSLNELLADQSNLENTIVRLHAAQQALDHEGVTDTSNRLVAPRMRLVLIPWAIYDDWLTEPFGLNGSVSVIRTNQGFERAPEAIDEDVPYSIDEDVKMYRSPISGKRQFSLSAAKYVEERLKTDGQWGLMLAQVSRQACASPPDFTERMISSRRIKRAGQRIDALGILEWVALTTQFNPGHIKFDKAALPGNCYDDLDDDKTVIKAGWNSLAESDVILEAFPDPRTMDDIESIRYGVM